MRRGVPAPILRASFSKEHYGMSPVDKAYLAMVVGAMVIFALTLFVCSVQDMLARRRDSR